MPTLDAQPSWPVNGTLRTVAPRLCSAKVLPKPLARAAGIYSWHHTVQRPGLLHAQPPWAAELGPGQKHAGPVVRPRKRAVTGHPLATLAAGDVASTAEGDRSSSPRAHRLEALVLVRKLYRNLLRADLLLSDLTPVYEEGDRKGAAGAPRPDGAAAAEEAARVRGAIARVAEACLTAEQLRAELKAVRACEPRFGRLLAPGDAAAAEERVHRAVHDAHAALRERVERGLHALPFDSPAEAQAAVDARNARYRVLPSPPVGPTGDGAEWPGEAGGTAPPPGWASDVGSVASRDEPCQQRLTGSKACCRSAPRPHGLVEGVRAGTTWTLGLWGRLNGGGPSPRSPTPASLPLPPPAAGEEERVARAAALAARAAALERRLRDASKAREARLRRSGPAARLRASAELRAGDEAIAALSCRLVVLTLVLEMEAIHNALEDEVLDLAGSDQAAGAWGRRGPPNRLGSSDEVAVLIAEFKVLDEQLTPLAASAEEPEDQLLYVEDAELARLADDVTDLRTSVGVGDAQVLGGGLFNLSRVQFQAKEGMGKLIEGVEFGARGMRLLGSDVVSAATLVGRAAAGGTLKQREVQALRRTSRDVLALIPFTAALLMPLTPVGHVLVFSIIQRYFPGLFPSQFTSRRQELMSKYEALKAQLQTAQLLAEQEGDELEFQRAAAAAAAGMGERGLEASGRGGGQPEAPPLRPSAWEEAQSARLQAAEQGGGVEGPAAAAVRELKQRLDRAAKKSYTDTGEGAAG